MQAIRLAIGLGGWETDPSDPFKAPYSPEAATMAAAKRYEITDPQTLRDIQDYVEAAKAADGGGS